MKNKRIIKKAISKNILLKLWFNSAKETYNRIYSRKIHDKIDCIALKIDSWLYEYEIDSLYEKFVKISKVKKSKLKQLIEQKNG